MQAFCDLCSNLVERFDKSWGAIGWTLFIGWFLAPFALITNLALLWPVSLTLFGLLLVWWAIDAADQQVAAWQVLAGLVLLGIGFLPRGGFLTLAAWVLYWMKVRE